MGTMDMCGSVIGGVFDWNTAYGTVDWLKGLVKEADLDIEIHGDGLLVPRHMCDPKQVLSARLDEAFQHIEDARQICMEVLEAL